MTAPQPTDAGLAALKPCPWCDGPTEYVAPSLASGPLLVRHRGRPHCAAALYAITVEQWNHRPSPTTGGAGLADEIEVAIEAFHDALPRGQGETGDGGVAGKAMCQMFYDNADAILSALRQPAPRADDALREALKPFADCCEWIDDSESDEEWAKFRLLIGDYRRARAALAASEEPKRAEGEGS